MNDFKKKIKISQIKKEYLDYILNYFLFKKWLPLYSKSYKIIIKDIWCNAQCPMCKDWKYKWNLNEIKKNLYITILKIIKDKSKKKKIYILWGEPLLIFEDLIKIIKLWTKYNIKFDFPTNASLLTINKIHQLINAGLDSFTFSIDFPNKKHDKWRNLKWTYEKIIQFTEYLNKININVQWNIVVWKFNFSEIINFNTLLSEISPNKINFINLHDEYEKLDFNKINILWDEELKEINIIFKNLETIFQSIQFNFNWFIKKINKNKLNTKCYLPLNMSSYLINDKWITETMCHYHWEVRNKNKFIYNAINKWCTKCDTTYKYNINKYINDILL